MIYSVALSGKANLMATVSGVLTLAAIAMLDLHFQLLSVVSQRVPWLHMSFPRVFVVEGRKQSGFSYIFW